MSILARKILFILFLLFEISSCTLGGAANDNHHGTSGDSDKNSTTALEVSLLSPHIKDSDQVSVNPEISFRFNRRVNNVNHDNIYITDSDSNIYAINDIQKQGQDADTIYTIKPILSYDTNYTLVFSSGISDYYGNKLSSEFVNFHTVKDDDSGGDQGPDIKVDFLKPTIKENVKVSSNIVFKLSEQISSKVNILDVVKLYQDGINGTTVNVKVTHDQNTYTVVPNILLQGNTNYCLLIKDPTPAIPGQHIGSHQFCFNTAVMADYGTLLSYKDNIPLNSAVLIQLRNNVSITESDISFIELSNKPENPYSIITFNYEKLSNDLYKIVPTKPLPRDGKFIVLINYPEQIKQQMFYISTSVLGVDTLIEKTDCLSSKSQCVFNINFSEAMRTNYMEKLHNTVKIYQDVIDSSHQLKDFSGVFVNLNPEVLTITLNTGVIKDNKHYFVVIDGINDPIKPNDTAYHLSSNVMVFDKDIDYAKMLSPNTDLSVQSQIIFEMNNIFDLKDFSFKLTDSSNHNVEITYEKFGDTYYRITPRIDLTRDTNYIVYITNNILKSTQSFHLKTTGYSTVQSRIIQCRPTDTDCSFIIELSSDVDANQYTLDEVLDYSFGFGVYNNRIDSSNKVYMKKQFLDIHNGSSAYGSSKLIQVKLSSDYPVNTPGFIVISPRLTELRIDNRDYDSFANSIMTFNY